MDRKFRVMQSLKKEKKNRAEKGLCHFDRLPNELMQLILARLEMKKLIGLQVVCKKWMAVIGSIGHKTKSLCLAQLTCDKDDVNFLKKRSFGQFDLASFTTIKVKKFLSEHSQFQLSQLFPNIEHLVLNMSHVSDILRVMAELPLTQLTTLSMSNSIMSYWIGASALNFEKLRSLINSCPSLKRLYIRLQLSAYRVSLLAPTLARLEQFSCLSEEDTLVRLFGPNCTRVSISKFVVFGETDNCWQWHTINGHWLSTLTHLGLIHFSESTRIVEYLSKHATALRVLRLEACDECRLNPQVVANLAKLAHLTELYLEPMIFELSQLEPARHSHQLARLVSVRSCTLSIDAASTAAKMDSLLFASVLSTIFANVQHLNITTFKECHYATLEGVESTHLASFPQLQTHSFSLTRQPVYYS